MSFYFLKIEKLLSNNILLLFIFVLLANIIHLAIENLLVPSATSLETATCQWDCFWYKEIASHSYSAVPRLYDTNRLAQADWAFFPLFPLAARFVGRIFHLSFEWSGLLLNLFLWSSIITLSYKDTSERIGKVSPLLFSIFFIIYPFNVWYHTQYSESIYGFFLILLVIGLKNNNIIISSLSSFFLSLSRPTGFILTCILSLQGFLKKLKNSFLLSKNIQFEQALFYFLTIVVAGSGLACYILYLYHLTGDGLAFLHVEKTWGKGIFPALDFNQYMQHKRRIIFFFYLIICLWLTWKMRARIWHLNMTIVISTLLLACCSGIASVERYIFSNPMVIEFLAFYAIRLKKEKAAILFAACFVGNLLTIFLWLRHSHILI